jgi:hypothetical protein
MQMPSLARTARVSHAGHWAIVERQLLEFIILARGFSTAEGLVKRESSTFGGRQRPQSLDSCFRGHDEK